MSCVQPDHLPLSRSCFGLGTKRVCLLHALLGCAGPRAGAPSAAPEGFAPEGRAHVAINVVSIDRRRRSRRSLEEACATISKSASDLETVRTVLLDLGWDEEVPEDVNVVISHVVGELSNVQIALLHQHGSSAEGVS